MGDKEGGGNQVQHWSGGTPSSPGRCHICNLDNQTHLYFNCSLLETFKKNNKVKKGVCYLCLKPFKLCQELLAKNKSKQCYLKFSKKANKTISLLCKVANHRHHYKVCSATTPPVAHGCIIIGDVAGECGEESVASDPLMGAGGPSSSATLQGSTTSEAHSSSGATGRGGTK